MRHLFATFVAVLLMGVPWLAVQYPEQAKSFYIQTRIAIYHVSDQAASVIMTRPAKTIEEIRAKYTSTPQRRKEPKKIRILLVPGHEPHFGGTEFGAIAERDLVVTLAQELEKLLRTNPKYEVFVTRDTNDWDSDLISYFERGWNEIIAWKDAHKQETAEMIQIGKYQKEISAIEHNTAMEDIALRLYGINKWAGENDMDIILHLHLNDYPRNRRSRPGEYSGFTIYVPEKQYSNSVTTQALASTIFGRLAKYNPVSDFPPESEGIVEDQDLIAVGSYNTVDAASMLIEYGYIYEPQFTNPDIRSLALKDLAFQTYIGLTDFFDRQKASELARIYDTTALPYHWKNTITGQNVENGDIFALQTALIIDGIYPPEEKSMTDCPRSGRLGPCTKKALKIFQEKNGITDEKDTLGEKTVEVLNRTYGGGI